MRRSVVSGALALLAVAGCGGNGHADSSTGPGERTAAASISDYWQRQGYAKTPADCLGQGFVRTFGLAHLQSLGVIDDHLRAQEAKATSYSSKADAPKAAKVILDCITLAGIMQQQYPTADAETAKCLADAYGQDRMLTAMTAQLEGEAAAKLPKSVTEKMAACVPPS
jgi:hypothetical protein